MLLPSILSELYNAARKGVEHGSSSLSKRADEKSTTFHTVSIILIPILVILSGIFAGLTLGYMSLDETQLNVLAASGTPKQREYARKIIPVRKNGHLLLITLLLGNMIVNETLPVISDEAFSSGITAVVVSTVLIVIFAEIIPQSVCTRHGLYIGAKMALPTRFIIYALWIVAWPVAKLLELILGPHHGIMYRRAELKELISMHSNISPHGGDLKHDTVTIIGHTLDLQEKVVKDAMTPISKVFMLPISAHLNYETLKQVCESGHSRIPVYEEVEIQQLGDTTDAPSGPTTVKKILGVLLVKHCVLLDPQGNVPIRSLPLNKIPSVPYDEPLLGILDRFQEGRSHMAIVSLFSKGRAASVKETVKRGLTRRFLNRVGLGDSDDEEAERDEDTKAKNSEDIESGNGNGIDKANVVVLPGHGDVVGLGSEHKAKKFVVGIEGREQAMPADAVLATKDAENVLRGIDTHVNPLGIITLEDVLEELIGEEILDEFDLTGPQAASSYVPPSASHRHAENKNAQLAATAAANAPQQNQTQQPSSKKLHLGMPASLNIFHRSRSHVSTPREGHTDSSSPPDKDLTTINKVAHGERDPMPSATTDVPSGTTLTGEHGNKDSSNPPPVTGTAPAGPLTKVPLTKAIIHTQNRRRAQLVRSNSMSADASGSGSGGGAILKPSFKSSSHPPKIVGPDDVNKHASGNVEDHDERDAGKEPENNGPGEALNRETIAKRSDNNAGSE